MNFSLIFYLFYHCVLSSNLLNIRILTMNRPKSLKKLLNSIESIDFQNYQINLEFFVDVDSKFNRVDNETLELIKSFSWDYGNKTFVVNKKSIGLKGQWFRPYYYDAPFVILEDDIELCNNFFEIAKKSLVHIKSIGRNDIFGISFQKLRLILKDDNCPNFKPNLFLSNNVEKNSTFFLSQMSTWAPIVFGDKWNELLKFYEYSKKSKFNHCIPGSIANLWYETSGTFMQFFLYAKNYFLMYFYLDEPIIVNNFEKGLHFKKKTNFEKCWSSTSELSIMFNSKIFFDQGFNIFNFSKITNINSILRNMDNKTQCNYKPNKQKCKL